MVTHVSQRRIAAIACSSDVRIEALVEEIRALIRQRRGNKKRWRCSEQCPPE